MGRVTVSGGGLEVPGQGRGSRALVAGLESRPEVGRPVSLDLEGYRSGSLNEVLPLAERTRS